MLDKIFAGDRFAQVFLVDQWADVATYADLSPHGNHLSVQGHAKMAALARAALREAIKHRP